MVAATGTGDGPEVEVSVVNWLLEMGIKISEIGVDCDTGGVTSLTLAVVATVGAAVGVAKGAIEVVTTFVALEALVGSGIVPNGGFELATGEEDGSAESTVGKATELSGGLDPGGGPEEGNVPGADEGAGVGDGGPPIAGLVFYVLV